MAGHTPIGPYSLAHRWVRHWACSVYETLIVFVLSREIFPQPDTQTLDADLMLATAIDIFLQGMQVSPVGADAPA